MEKESCVADTPLLCPLDAADNAAALQLWAAAARATHGFVSEEHLEQYRGMVQDMLQQRPLDLWGLYEVAEAAASGTAGDTVRGRLLAFMGVAEGDLGVLFVANGQRGRGFGTRMLRHAVQELGVRTVTVNEQNTAARRFYEGQGFVVRDRSAVDGVGNPYPLLHMELS